MLRGIKKTDKNDKNPAQSSADHSEPVAPVIDCHALRTQMQDEAESQSQESAFTGAVKACMQLYLSGETNKLRSLLAKLYQLRKQQCGVQQKKPSKFAYDFDLKADEEKYKRNRKERVHPIMASNRFQQTCAYCPDNEIVEIVSASNYVYLALAKRKTFKGYYHLILAPVDHEQTMVDLNQGILTEINNFKKCLLEAFDRMSMLVCFFEQYSAENSHIYVECLAVPLARGQDLPFFFKQALEAVEGNWTTHRNIIKIEKEKGGLQKQIPRKIQYFYIDFSLGYGYAHVIEDQKHWNRSFCYDILATALGLQPYLVKTTEEYTPEEMEERKGQFLKIWKAYDWTALI